jgi:6,7-dimethyl-8-ribityllumazine synthase
MLTRFDSDSDGDRSQRLQIDYTQKRVAIIISRFNTPITERLRSAAIDTLTEHGVPRANVDVTWVPGALEIPFAAARLQAIEDNGRPKYDAIMCLGCVIKGDTYHFEVVCNESAHGISDLNLKGKTPVLNGILTVYTAQQAHERSAEDEHNKGRESALAALDMIALTSATLLPVGP